MPASTSRTFTAYLFLLDSMALVGSYVALAKPLVSVFPIFTLALLRFALAAVCMTGWLRPPPAQATAHPTAAPKAMFPWKTVLMLSFFGNFLFSICMLYGVQYTSAVTAGLCLATIPTMTAVLSWLILREAISGRVLIAIALSCCAVGLLATTRLAAGSTYFVGILMLLGAVLCESLYVVIGKRLTGQLSAKQISAWINLCGLGLTLPFGLYQAWYFDFHSVSRSVWSLLVFYSLAASMWSVWLWMTGLKHIPAGHAGVFTVALPLSASAVGVIFLNESFTATHLLAMLAAVSGMLLVVLTPKHPVR